MLALVQQSRRERTLDVKLAATFDEFLQLPFDFDPRICPPTLHVLTEQQCRTGAAVSRAVEQNLRDGRFKQLPV